MDRKDDEGVKDMPALATRADELKVMTTVIAALDTLDDVARNRILQAVSGYFGLPMRSVASSFPGSTEQLANISSSPNSIVSFSEDRSLSPKQFLLQKRPQTDVERVACLAYYLTHYHNTPHFKTLDISKLNTEAAQVKFSNPAVAVENATKRNYLVPATKGNKQLSALGEQFVQALPDRDAAKTIMASARLRRKRKAASSVDSAEGD